MEDGGQSVENEVKRRYTSGGGVFTEQNKARDIKKPTLTNVIEVAAHRGSTNF